MEETTRRRFFRIGRWWGRLRLRDDHATSLPMADLTSRSGGLDRSGVDVVIMTGLGTGHG
ncbi:hypothetical protein NX02_28065 [Sphingomonas sanxanigenens DSM 19645 = NX02]|uniref:Uncharacterized protein n=1 Tax=Sphingomonas sanxanigenens DSM 19645 = NX02 TaxID=1123269 RepID=W0ANB7_9SPHN|nr:hypothetical protein NX02_28065 [Sphingomonas sanxanigenens DSM 19645 = NX02]